MSFLYCPVAVDVRHADREAISWHKFKSVSNTILRVAIPFWIGQLMRLFHRGNSMTSALHEKVADALRSVPREQYGELAVKSGLTLSWIRHFADERIPNPSASRLEALYKGITGHSIKIVG